MIGTMLQVIQKPRKLFAAMLERERLASYGIWIVILLAIVSSVQAYFSTQPIAQALPDELPLGVFSLVTAVIGAFVVSFVIWVVTGLIVRMTAGLEAKPWTVTAYSFVPTILMTLLSALAFLIFPVELDAMSLDFDSPEAFTQMNLALQAELQGSVALRIGQALNFVGTIWSLFIIYIAVNELTAVRARAMRSIIVLAALNLITLLGPWLFTPLE